MQLESSVTLFDDNKVENRFAELQVTADGITAEVGRKVGNDEVISRINQSAESIQIQANKVNIEGATIFSTGRLSQNSLNNAYDTKGSATSTVNALKSDLSSSSGTTIINGGHITTGTLSAGAVNANSGTFNTANIPNLNASKITAGTLSADRIGAGTLSVGKIDATSGTFNTANIPNLSATKITSDTINGARINAMGASGGARATLTSTGLDIYNSSNQKKASYGATQYIYGGNGTYPLISVDGTNARLMQSANNYANVNSSGMQIYQGGANVASFGSSTIELGKNSWSSTIKLCGSNGTVSSSQTGDLSLKGNAGLSLATNGSSYVYVGNDSVLISALSSGRAGADLWITSNSDEGDVVTVDCTQLQLIGRSGSASSLWLTGGTVPPSGAGTTAVWHQSSAGNYGLYRSSSSSRRYKEDIKPVEDDRLDPHRLYDLEVVQFKYKKGYFLPDEPYEQNRVDLIGFIAEDVMEHYPQAVLMENGKVENWEIRYIVPPMLKLIQEQNDRITELEKIYRHEVDE